MCACILCYTGGSYSDHGPVPSFLSPATPTPPVGATPAGITRAVKGVCMYTLCSIEKLTADACIDVYACVMYALYLSHLHNLTVHTCIIHHTHLL